ncbi:MAG: trimethylamine methyltransferase family protein [Acidobacteriota bacterium]
METIRPRLEVLSAVQVESVVGDALAVLERVGVAVDNEEGSAVLREAGCAVRDGRVTIGEAAVRGALATAPSRVVLYDREGAPALDLGGDRVHFDPGSAALWLLDPATNRRRLPMTADLRHLAWVTESCRHIAGQSTALVPSDVPETVADRFRLYVALVNGAKPVVTGTFVKDAFAVMRAMLAAVRGGDAALRERPLAIFDCCPSPPLAWSDLTCQALLDCARAGVPAQLVSMPLGGATAPVTLREMVVQHCAESLSGVVLHQLAAPGAPIVWGGSPAAFDMRHGTTPMGAVETMMVDVADAQVGRTLGLPTHAYMGMSDAKVLDWQTGMESGIGAMLGALGGINLVSGPGMLDFESCQSLEKLVLDDEICGLALRLTRGVSHGSADRAVELLEQLVRLGGFLGHRHTRENFRSELHIAGPLVERGTYDDWERRGGREARDVAAERVRAILGNGCPAPLADDVREELGALLVADARRLGIDALPEA